MSEALGELRILVQDGSLYRKYAKVDWLDSGNGVLIYDYQTGRKLSRHSDGRIWDRIGGAGQPASLSTSVPFSDIEHEQVYAVPIPVDATNELPLYHGERIADAFVFSSTVMNSNGTFAAEIVDNSRLSRTLAAWRAHPAYVSAQTCRSNELGKMLILTVLNQRST